MGGATIWPVPRAMDAEAHYYPRRWKRNVAFLYGGLFLIGLQINRYCNLHRVSYSPSSLSLADPSLTLSLVCSPLTLAIDNSHGPIHGLGKQGCSKARQIRLKGVSLQTHLTSTT